MNQGVIDVAGRHDRHRDRLIDAAKIGAHALAQATTDCFRAAVNVDLLNFPKEESFQRLDKHA